MIWHPVVHEQAVLLPVGWRFWLQGKLDDEFRAWLMSMKGQLGIRLRYEGANDPHAESRT